MRSVVVILLFCFIRSTVTGQNYIQYHHLVMQAETYIVKGNLSSALEMYDSAFSGFAQPFARDLFNALICAKKNNQSSKSLTYLDKLGNKGLPLSFFQSKVCKPMRKLSGWKTFIDAYPSRLQRIGEQINYSLKKELDSLLKLDQEFRLKKGSYEVHGDTIKKQDSLIMIRIKEILSEHGYPDENLIGITNPQTFDPPHYVIIRHYYQTKHLDLSDILLTSVKEGKLSPRVFAELEDKKSNWMGSGDKYGTTVIHIVQGKELPVVFSPAEQLKLDSTRKSIGLESLEDLKLKIQFSKKNKDYSFHLHESVVYWAGITLKEWNQMTRNKSSK